MASESSKRSIKLDCSAGGVAFWVTVVDPGCLNWASGAEFGNYMRFERPIADLRPSRPNQPYVLAVTLENADLYTLTRPSVAGEGFRAQLISKGRPLGGPYDDEFWDGEVAGKPVEDPTAEQLERILNGPKIPFRKIMGRVRISGELLEKVDNRVDKRPAIGQKRAYFDE